jgi:CBS domain-containing protein
MQVKDIMTDHPACCTFDTSLRDVARMMVDCDCGEIPVVDAAQRPIGVVTDRDITCRAVAQGKNPLEMKASDVMSHPVITVRPDTDVDDACDAMETHQIRRVPVVDDDGKICGIVAQADIARNAPEEETAEMVKDVSQPTAGSRA